MGQKLPYMLADGLITVKCSFGSAMPDFLRKLGIVLLKEFQQGFLLDTDAEIGIFQRLHTHPSASVLGIGGLPPHESCQPHG